MHDHRALKPFSKSNSLAKRARRRQAGPIMDSADDMTSGGRTPYSSASEFGANTNFGALPSQNLPGLADRQDSANYQPRPPALAERQDSAQNLQVKASGPASLYKVPDYCTQAAIHHQTQAHQAPIPFKRAKDQAGLLVIVRAATVYTLACRETVQPLKIKEGFLFRASSAGCTLLITNARRSSLRAEVEVAALI